MDTLYKKNRHQRDKSVKFEEKTHVYTIDNKKGFTSVTSLVHMCFPKFDADKIIDKMMSSWRWKQNKYYGKTKQEIKDEWKKNGTDSANAGTKMHLLIEQFYNDLPIYVDEDNIEFTYFENFHKNEIENSQTQLEPYRTEWMVYDKELKLAGSIDMVFIDKNNDLHIYDWKRCKEIKKDNKWETASLECLEPYDIPNSNFWHYAFQLNIYKYIIEKNYNKTIKSLYLVCLHPNNKKKNYIKLYVPFLTNQIKELMEYRKEITLA